MAEYVELEVGWNSIECGFSKLNRILNGSSESISTKEHIDLYTVVHAMCTQPPPYNYRLELYERYKTLWKDYVASIVLSSLRDLQDEFFLRELTKRWENQKIMAQTMNHFFWYLCRWDESNTFRFPMPVRELGLSYFVDLAIVPTSEKVVVVVLKLIDREREGEQIDQSLIKNVFNMFIEVGMYDSLDGLKHDMVLNTASYYSTKSVIWVEEDTCPEYLLKVEACLRREKEMASYYLQSCIEQKKWLEEVENHLLSSSNGTIILMKENSGYVRLLKDDKVDDLARMYRLFSRQPHVVNILSQILKQHVIDEGMALVKRAEDAVRTLNSEVRRELAGLHAYNFVGEVIGLQDKYFAHVRLNGCFHGSHLICRYLKEAFELFCNYNVVGCTLGELLPDFCDKLLRKGGVDRLGHEAIETTLYKVVRLLEFIFDRDLFVEFYRKKLAKRLLSNSSFSDELEKYILFKLKQYLGPASTFNMEGMFSDMAIAEDNKMSFKKYLADDGSNVSTAGVELSVSVLRTGHWPRFKESDVNLPAELVKCVDVFKDFYRRSYVHRKLRWMYSLGTCHITGEFGKSSKELVVTTHQACLLMLFNSVDRLSCSEIITQLNLPAEDVVTLLESLSCGKYKIFTKDPSTKTVSSTDIFEFNTKFTHKYKKINIPLPQMNEKKNVVEEVNEFRKYSIDAVIVRIMKNRKVLDYQQLVAECVEQLTERFLPEIKLIKRRIEDLISREYLARDGDRGRVLKYLAQPNL